MFDDINIPLVAWFIAGAVLILAEMVLPGVILVFFGAGAWVVALLLLVWSDMPLSVQIIIWLISSLAFLFLLRRWLTRQFSGFVGQKDDMTEMPDTFKGTHVKVIEDIVPEDNTGMVRLNGTPWRATADMRISAGSTVEVVSRKNLVVIVRPLLTRAKEEDTTT